MYYEAPPQHVPPPLDPRPSHRLTVRPVKYKFTAADFEAYEHSRRYIFRDPRIARAALLAGGILWRLAIEDAPPDLVLDGPDPTAYQLGIGFRLQDEKGCYYIDDDLTNEEVSNILGTYFEQPKPDRVKWDNDTYPMWWPPIRHIKGSALDFPTWTPVAENWYRTLRSKYRRGDLAPKKGVEWRTSVRNWDKRARRVMERSNESADIFLNRMYLP